MSAGERQHRLGCLDKLGLALRGDPHMTLAPTVPRARATPVFPEARFGAFEAHYVPGLDRALVVQNLVKVALERLPPFRPSCRTTSQ